jgi:hypothetical protein
MARVETKKRAFRSKNKTDERKKMRRPPLNFLTKKAPYKGPGADSEEKHESAGDIDTEAVDGLKALDPKRPIREADIGRYGWDRQRDHCYFWLNARQPIKPKHHHTVTPGLPRKPPRALE